MKKTLLFACFIVLTIGTQAQVVMIPDTNFVKALIAKGVDTNNDGKIQTSEAATVNSLVLSSSSISDLTGIEAFTSIFSLDCNNNQLTSLDISKNQKLNSLSCRFNSLSKLDVSANSALRSIDCNHNQLTDLDVSMIPALQTLDCRNNQILKMDVTKNTGLVSLYASQNPIGALNVVNNTALTSLECINNQLSVLDITHNTSLLFFYCISNQLSALDLSKNQSLLLVNCSGNVNLKDICISSSQVSKTSNWVKDVAAQWNPNCGVVTGIDDETRVASKVLVKIFTSLGQEVQKEEVKEGLFIYQYSDGSTRKVMIK